MVIDSSRAEVITKTADHIVATKPIELEINQDKTKYITIHRRNRDIQNLVVCNYTFQVVTKY